MNLSDRLAECTPHEIQAAVPDLYASLITSKAVIYGEHLVNHCGLWGKETKTEYEAMERANRMLVSGCELGVDQHVLDAGCGIGNTAIWLARTYGVRVTGVSICKPEVEFATEHAALNGVSHLVEFHHADFMNLPFPDNTFDVVLNQESFCYAADQPAYLKGVLRVLKPGGRWQAMEPLISGEPQSEKLQKVHASMQFGFRLPPLAVWHDVVKELEQANFENVRFVNLDSEVKPFSQMNRNRWTWVLLTRPKNMSQLQHEFVQGTCDFDEGMQQGLFCYLFLSATKPA